MGRSKGDEHMRKCDVCGKRAEGLGTYPTQINDCVLCSDCYEGLKIFNPRRQFQSIAKFKENKEAVLKLIHEKNFPANVICQFEVFYMDKEHEVIAHTGMVNITENGDQCMMSSGYNFEGYDIIAYHGVICGECVLGTGFMSSFDASISDMLGEESIAFGKKLQQARDTAKKRASVNALQLGGNAIIGVDIDYIMFSSNMIGVIFNGTSVQIQKKKSDTQI